MEHAARPIEVGHRETTLLEELKLFYSCADPDERASMLWRIAVGYGGSPEAHDAVVEALSDAEPLTRQMAFLSADLVGPSPRMRNALLQGVRSERPCETWAAALALGKLHLNDCEVVQALLTVAKEHRDWIARAGAVKALGMMGASASLSEVRSELRLLCDDGDSHVRDAARDALAQTPSE